MKRRIIVLTTSVIMLLSISAAGFAQDYSGRYRRDTRASRYYGGNVKESVKRLDKLSGQLKNDVDRALDRSSYDGRNREDRINDVVNDFHSAAAEFKDRFDDGRDPGRAEQEARRVLDLGYQLDRIIGRNELGSQVESKWSQIMNNLRVIQDLYENQSAYDYRNRY